MILFCFSLVGGFYFMSNDVDDLVKIVILRGGLEGVWNRIKIKYIYILLFVRNKVGGNLVCLFKWMSYILISRSGFRGRVYFSYVMFLFLECVVW